MMDLPQQELIDFLSQHLVSLAENHRGKRLLAWALKAGVDPNGNADLFPPLHAAAMAGNEAAVVMLLEAGADVNGQYLGYTPLTLANGEGAAGQLIKAGAAITSMALVEASSKGDEGVVRVLLDAGADVNETYNGVTPLLHAVHNGHAGVVRMLLDAGAWTPIP